MQRRELIQTLETALGYHFQDGRLRDQALTHSSVKSGRRGHADNERMEFLGDRVLGLAIAELLLEMHPKAPEGDLARLYNMLVRGATCAAIGTTAGVNAVLILSESEAAAGGRDKPTIVADAVEALLGAVFLEAGFDKAREVVGRLWRPHIQSAGKARPDAKTALQEWAQGRGLALPKYAQLQRSGPDHAPVFMTEVAIEGAKPASGEGGSKQAAEQAAARALLKREGYDLETDHDA